ncbi:isochorismatase family protein [Acetobacter musti]|uniref:Isochorismatase family protein n=1 Tax=Acetobacter musti TaxID=864732 RepID=A0ABX0JM99_9PROT|nr:isochorismatase family cysteine hydrolase [Acetobacter musti]NHN84120.1 isochorismatase family protein [Acetobacter musti]
MKSLGSSRPNVWQVSKEAVSFVRPPALSCPVTIPARPQMLTFDLARSAILVIDMQNDFCHPDGWLASIGVDIAPVRKPISPLQTVLPALRLAGVPVLWVNWGNRPDRSNLSPSLLHVYNPDGESTGIGDRLSGQTEGVLEEGSWNAAIVDELKTEADDIHVAKYRMSGFWDTPLDSILRNLRVDTLLFAGVNVDQCVLSTLADASCLGYDSILLEDCCATTSPQYCSEATLYNVRQCFGFTALSSELNSACSAGAGL